jgi:hypothetical protein
MRITFTVDLRVEDKGIYPSDDKIAQFINSLGWKRRVKPNNTSHHELEQSKPSAPRELSEKGIEKLIENEDPGESFHITEQWKDRIVKLLELMKEVLERRGNITVIYYGYIQEQQTEFIITREIDSQITFRFLNENMSNLQRAAERVIRQLKRSKSSILEFSKPRSEVINVYLYEKGEDHVIIQGRIIQNHLLETVRRNQVITVIGGGCALLGVAILGVQQPLVYNLGDASSLTQNITSVLGQLDRVSSGLIVAAITSILQLIGLWWDLKRRKVVFWDFSANS